MSSAKKNIIIASSIAVGIFGYLVFDRTLKDKIFAPYAVKSEYNCTDFKTQKAAQSFFVSNGGPEKDPYKLDKNKDGIACETLP